MEQEPPLNGPTIIYERQMIDKNQEYQGEKLVREHTSHFEVDMPVGVRWPDGSEVRDIRGRSDRG